jgi:pimeloyl-ACP methyl ester carboxylesterase
LALVADRLIAGGALVGHSYSGMVVSGVADRLPERIRALIVLDGFVPQDGQSMRDFWPPELQAEWDAKGAATGGLSVPPITAEAFGVNEHLCAWVNKNCTPQPYATFTEKIRLRGGHERVPQKLYIRGANLGSKVLDGLAS